MIDGEIDGRQSRTGGGCRLKAAPKDTVYGSSDSEVLRLSGLRSNELANHPLMIGHRRHALRLVLILVKLIFPCADEQSHDVLLHMDS